MQFCKQVLIGCPLPQSLVFFCVTWAFQKELYGSDKEFNVKTHSISEPFRHSKRLGSVLGKDGVPSVCIDTRLHKGVWAPTLPRKHNKDKGHWASSRLWSCKHVLLFKKWDCSWGREIAHSVKHLAVQAQVSLVRPQSLPKNVRCRNRHQWSELWEGKERRSPGPAQSCLKH